MRNVDWMVENELALIAEGIARLDEGGANCARCAWLGSCEEGQEHADGDCAGGVMEWLDGEFAHQRRK